MLWPSTQGTGRIRFLFQGLRPSPHFFFFVQRRIRFLVLGSSVGLKKKNFFKSQEVSEYEVLVPKDKQNAEHTEKMFLFLFLFFSTLLLCSFFRLKESFQVKNGLTTSLLLLLLFFFFKMPKIWTYYFLQAEYCNADHTT